MFPNSLPGKRTEWPYDQWGDWLVDNWFADRRNGDNWAMGDAVPLPGIIDPKVQGYDIVPPHHAAVMSEATKQLIFADVPGLGTLMVADAVVSGAVESLPAASSSDAAPFQQHAVLPVQHPVPDDNEADEAWLMFGATAWAWEQLTKRRRTGEKLEQ